MTIDLYIRSSGVNEEQDYAWVKLPEHPDAVQTPQEPSFLSDKSIDELIYRQHFSLLLGRYDGKLALQITGLTASTRRDYQNRVIRNSIACIGDPEDERTLRSIAVAALEDPQSLETRIDKAIIYTPEGEGFRVLPVLRSSLEQYEGLVSQESEEGNIRGGFGKKSDKLKKEVITWLKTKTLPYHRYILVVTDFVPKEVLRDKGVWLGLSSVIDKEVDDADVQWYNIERIEANKHANTGSTPIGKIIGSRIWSASLLILIVVIAIVAFFLFTITGR